MLDVERVRLIGPTGRWTTGGSEGVDGIATAVVEGIATGVGGTGAVLVEGLATGGEALTGGFDDDRMTGTGIGWARIC